MNKEVLRKLYLQKRTSLSEVEFRQLNLKLVENFFAQFDLTSIRTLHIFLPIEKKREPDTWPIIDRIRTTLPQIRIVIPKVNQHTGQLENYLYEGFHKLQLNAWGILEPLAGVQVLMEEIDMILVPLLAFDRQGHRVGYGGGFYDRLISQCRENCTTVGLSLFDPVPQINDINAFDQQLSSAITPSGIFFFKNS